MVERLLEIRIAAKEFILGPAYAWRVAVHQLNYRKISIGNECLEETHDQPLPCIGANLRFRKIAYGQYG
jgi:hypothetical protein